MIAAKSISCTIFFYPDAWCNRHVVAFFQTSVLKELRILYPLSPQQYLDNANIAKVQNKASTS